MNVLPGTCITGPHSSESAVHLSLIGIFIDIFSAHGALGYRNLLSFEKIKTLTESEKLRVVPIIFSLVPGKALKSDNIGYSIKPFIREHLNELGITEDDRLLEILKRIVDQYTATDKKRPSDLLLRKMGIADLRSNRPLYKKIFSGQNGRCPICGSNLGVDCTESLDHIIPFRLIGDIIDGSNWQILCDRCNRGKREYFSSLQSLESLNWLYGRSLVETNTLSDEGRYVTYMRMRKCTHPGCSNTAGTSKLFIKHKNITGLALPFHMKVLCEKHQDF